MPGPKPPNFGPGSVLAHARPGPRPEAGHVIKEHDCGQTHFVIPVATPDEMAANPHIRKLRRAGAK